MSEIELSKEWHIDQKTTRLKQINCDLYVAEARVKDLGVAKREIQKDLLFIETGARVGSLVKIKEKVYRITSFDFKYWEPGKKPWANGNLRKKDGTFSEQAHHLYTDWILIPE